MFRRLVLVVIVCSVLVPAARADAYGWMQPVPGEVARPFDPPQTRYGPGHLGVDFSAPPGTPVRAAGPGVVVFAGVVANARHVVIRHAGDLRTTYSFLSSIRVNEGDTVEPGDILGTTGGTGVEHDGSVLHFGLRRGDQYVDPMPLFDGSLNLAARVHLAAVDAPTDEQTGLTDEFPPVDYPILCSEC